MRICFGIRFISNINGFCRYIFDVLSSFPFLSLALSIHLFLRSLYSLFLPLSLLSLYRSLACFIAIIHVTLLLSLFSRLLLRHIYTKLHNDTVNKYNTLWDLDGIPTPSSHYVNENIQCSLASRDRENCFSINRHVCAFSLSIWMYWNAIEWMCLVGSCFVGSVSNWTDADDSKSLNLAWLDDK